MSGDTECWEKMKCGKGPDSENPCVVVDHDLSNGYLGGINGSRACFFIKGTTCYPDDKEMTVPEKMATYCLNCDFYKEIVTKEGLQANLFFYFKFISEKLESQGRHNDLIQINLEMFHS